MNMQRITVTVLATVLAFTSGLAARTANAAQIVVPKVPLIVSIDAVPNIWFQMDDSGSMDWEILAGNHYPDCRYNPLLQCSDSTPPDSGRMQSWTGEWDEYDEPDVEGFSYIFDLPSGDHTYGDNCGGDNSGNSTEDCFDDFGNSGTTRQSNPGPDVYRNFTVTRDWRIRSASVNVQFFNPNIDYVPWVGSSTTFSDSGFTNARSWPVPGEAGYSVQLNLGTADEGGPFYYHVWIDDKGWNNAHSMPSANPVNMTVGANGVVDQWDSYIRVSVGSSAVTCTKVTHDPKNYSWSSEVRGLNPTVSPATTAECTAAKGNKSDAALRQDVANWFTYYRRRTHVARGAVGSVVEGLPNYRYGIGHINSSSASHYIPATDIPDYDVNNEDVLDELYGRDRTSNSTPLRRGLERIGRMYGGELSGISSPIILSCQKNFTLLFSDGFWNGGDPFDVTSDVDGDGQTVEGEGVTLADVAKYYYENDLRTDLPNNVPTDSFDSASYQHMVTYTIAFGLEGGLVDTDDDGWPNPALDDNDDWYPLGDDRDKVDDMWHAAWNARGQYFNAQRPEELYENVRDALTDIASRIGGAASAAANSGSISSTSRIFQAKFDSADWHGELLAYPVNDDGTLGSTAVWEANTLLGAKTNAQLSARNVWTWNNDGTTPNGSAFEWASISSAQGALLNKDADGNTDGLGQQRLEYIKGVDTYEVANGGTFRDRSNKLGDIVNSDPMYVGFPPFFYPFDNYQAYFTANVNRPGVIYLGANDGMMHAVREATGEILFSYVPDKVFSKLSKLTDPDYEHEYFVDGPPGYGDALIGSAWKSIVSGALRSGGQAVYALDVTDPLNFDAGDVLWEFSDEVDADLGYVWGEPQIKRMQNGKWAVIIGSGLNNSEADGHASTTGKGYLFILYIEQGINGWATGDYVKIEVPGGDTVTPNGLFTPAAADIDGDARVDYIYAGDRFGKMWKFDVTSANDGNWDLDFNGAPFFDAGTGHPITDRPAIAAHPQGRSLGQLVMFGTGKYIETSDNETTGQPVQTMYALWDFDKGYATGKGLGVSDISGYAKSDLQQNSFSVASGVRVIQGGTRVDWLDGNNDPNSMGWYLDLPEAGERMVRRPVLRDNLVFFVTMTPNTDPCSAGGTGWISVLDISTGLAPTFPVFDIDNDQDVTTGDDTIEPSGGDPDDDSDNLVPVGINSPSIPNLPALIYDDRPGFSSSTTPQFPPEPNGLRGCDSGSARAYTFTTGSNGSILAIETATEALSCGRQNWRGER